MSKEESNRRKNIERGKKIQGRLLSVAHSAAKQKTKKALEKLLWLLMWELWSAKGSPLYVYFLKRSICCWFAWKRNREAFFSSYAILHGTSGSIAAVLWLNEEEGGKGRQINGRREGERGRRARKAVRGLFLLIVAAEVVGVSGFISA